MSPSSDRAPRIAFTASDRPEALAARETLVRRYGSVDPEEADVIVALGGDGFMLETLHTVMERLLESVSFEASERSGVAVKVDGDYVQRNLGELSKDQDLARYVL